MQPKHSLCSCWGSEILKVNVCPNKPGWFWTRFNRLNGQVICDHISIFKMENLDAHSMCTLRINEKTTEKAYLITEFRNLFPLSICFLFQSNITETISFQRIDKSWSWIKYRWCKTFSRLQTRPSQCFLCISLESLIVFLFQCHSLSFYSGVFYYLPNYCMTRQVTQSPLYCRNQAQNKHTFILHS